MEALTKIVPAITNTKIFLFMVSDPPNFYFNYIISYFFKKVKFFKRK